jgi:hypothetical protein
MSASIQPLDQILTMIAAGVNRLRESTSIVNLYKALGEPL